MVRSVSLVVYVSMFCMHSLRAETAVSVSPPGGLSAGSTPQMVLITFDDAVSQEMTDVVLPVLDGRVNPNGTPIQATFFVSMDGWVNDYYAIERLYCAGHEIALHTLTHTTGVGTDLDTWRRELGACRQVLSSLANIPLGDLRGFRAPFLQYNPASFAAISELGLRYDASLVTYPGDGVSMNRNQLIWPYTLHDGVQTVCESGVCPTEIYPDLFSVPLWPLMNDNDERMALMDPVLNLSAGLEDNYDSVLLAWRRNFLYRFNGNRAPMGIWLHAAYGNQWFRGAAWRARALEDFITWAQNYPGVWFVSVGDCVDYMEQPFSADSVGAFPPFVNTPKIPRPAKQVRTNLYNNGVVVTATEPPPTRPAFETLFDRWVDTPAVTYGQMIYPPYGAGIFDGFIEVTNQSAEVFASFELQFDLSEGVITNLYGHSYTVDGQHYTFEPYSGGGTALPMDPGEVLRISFRGGAATNGTPTLDNLELNFRNVERALPAIETMVNDGSGMLALEWNASGFEYAVESSDDLVSGVFTPVSNVWNRSSVEVPVAGSSTARVYRVRALDAE